MAKRIDTVFTADPNAGNDPSKTASVAVDFGTSTEEAYSLEQISSVVANRLGISENLPDQATFSARFPDNSLIATVDPIQTAYEYYVINTTGTTPTGGGSTGALAFTAADYDSHPYYLYISDDDSTYGQVEPADTDPNNDGLDPPGLILKAKYLLAPPAITDLAVVVGANGSGQMTLNYTAPTVVDGAASTIAYFTRTDTNTQVATYTGLTPGTTISNLPNDVEMQIRVVVTANNGETSVSNLVTDTIPVDVDPAYDGEISIDKTSEYREDEITSIPITFKVDGSQSDANVRFTARLVADTALAGTNYTDWADPLTVNITNVSGGSGSVVVNVVPIDADESENNVLQVHIIPESVDVGVGNGTATIANYPDNAALVYIDGTGGAAGTSTFEIDSGLTDGVTTADGFSFLATNYESKSDQDATSFFRQVDKDEDVGGVWDNMDTMPADYMVVDDGDYSTTDYIGNASVLNYSLDFGSTTGTFYLYAYSFTSDTYRRHFWPVMDGAASWSNGLSTKARVGAGDSGDRTWQWYACKDATLTPLTVTISTGGIHTFSYYHHEDDTYVYKFVLVNDNAFDPSLVGVTPAAPSAEDDGPVETSQASGTIIDNPSNIGAPTNPVPPSGTVVPDYFPLDGATGIGTTATVTLTFEVGASAIQVPTGGFVESEYATDATVINGTVSVLDNVLTWTPLSSRANLTKYKIVANGTVVDNAGVVKNWSLVKDDLDFTTLDQTAGGSVVLTLNPSQWALDRDITRTDMINWIGTDGGSNTQIHLDNGGIRNVLDPFGSGESVWKVRFDELRSGVVDCGFVFDKAITPVDEIYWMTELALCNTASDGFDWVSPAGLHMPFMRNGASFSATTTKSPDGWAAFHQLLGNNAYIDSVWQLADGTDGPYKTRTLQDHNLTAYMYTRQGYQQNWFPDPSDITQRSNVNVVNAPVWKSGQYTRCEFYMKLNTVTGGTTLADAEFKMWVDGALVMDISGFRFRGDGASASKLIDKVQYTMWTGGPPDNVKYFHPRTQWMYIKNFIVSADPISHG